MKKISIYNSFIKDNNNKRDYFTSKLRQNGFKTGGDGDILIVIGGDGTFLSAIRKRLDQNPIFVGFNTGNLGYLSEFTIDQMDEFVRMLKKEEYYIEKLPVYEVKLKENGEERIEYFVNDIVIERKSTRILHMSLHINDEKLCSISADGVIVSSALGSTGYNMSAGGAIIVDPKDNLQIAPIAPVFSKAYQSLSSSIIVGDQNEITIFPNYKKQREFRIVCDGKEIKMKNPRFVEIKKSEHCVQILRSKKFEPISHLKSKILREE